jgi:mannosyltransferase OCH1-like enzyme
MNIIQTWKTKDIPIDLFNYIEKIRTLNPNCNYMFFDDNDIDKFMKSTKPEYYECFCNLTEKIQQIDFFRYVAIYYYGGLYLDLDIDIVSPFDDIDINKCIFPIELKHPSDEILIKNNLPSIGNYAFYAPKGHPFIKMVIDNILNQRLSDEIIEKASITHGDTPRDVRIYYTTGPILISQTYYDYVSINNDDSVVLLEPSPYMDNCFGKYGFHKFYGSWRLNTIPKQL